MAFLKVCSQLIELTIRQVCKSLAHRTKMKRTTTSRIIISYSSIILLQTDFHLILLFFLLKAVVPNMAEKYMREQLNVTSYPTHILIDKDGKIVKVVNAISDLIPYIAKQGNKASL